MTLAVPAVTGHTTHVIHVTLAELERIPSLSHLDLRYAT